ncbi:MAG: energy-coupling factor transporter transmembrane protein EcfT [Syntrophomonadaceae bacterium]|jgi:energy-coupling factor transport system permease protein|nr:energy-coupling factor transporter transmembrane protein EcfT [Syntrophomonadaceae bacterium]
MSFYHNVFQKRTASIIKGFLPGLSYVENSSWVHRLHPLVKLVMLISFSLTVFAVPTCLGGLVLFGIMLVFYGLAGLGLAFFYRKLRFIMVFGLFIFIIQVLVVQEGRLLWQAGVGPLQLSIWSQGLFGGLNLALRFVNIIGSSYLFVATTDPNRLTYSLMQAGLPYRLGFMLITALRFIPVFHYELEQVKNAQMAKGIEIEGLSPGQLVKAVKYLLVPLVITALSKVDYLAISMESRGFGLYPRRSYLYVQSLSRGDKIAMGMIPLVFILFNLTIASRFAW